MRSVTAAVRINGFALMLIRTFCRLRSPTADRDCLSLVTEQAASGSRWHRDPCGGSWREGRNPVPRRRRRRTSGEHTAGFGMTDPRPLCWRCPPRNTGHVQRGKCGSRAHGNRSANSWTRQTDPPVKDSGLTFVGECRREVFRTTGKHALSGELCHKMAMANLSLSRLSSSAGTECTELAYAKEPRKSTGLQAVSQDLNRSLVHYHQFHGFRFRERRSYGTF